MPNAPEIITAKTAGFCFGVKRAVSAVEEIIKDATGPVFTLGPIIHNEQVVEEFARQGVGIISDPKELEGIENATVVIRSHGVSMEVENRLRLLAAKVVDATCPFVKKIHRAVYEASRAGRLVIVAGDASHPEVKGITGWCCGPVMIIGSEDEETVISDTENVTIVSQTTFNNKKFKKIVENIRNKCYSCDILNTICNATRERQKEAEEIAANVDAMIVLGGRNSSNTQKLYSLCEAVCPHTIYAQTVSDLADDDFYGLSSVGITAGASTPTKIIEEVQNYVGRKF